MNTLSWIVDPSFTTRLTVALLHFLWQGCAGGLLVIACGALFRDASARFRYTLNVAALILMAACLPVTFCLVEIPAIPVDQTLALPKAPERAPSDSVLNNQQTSSVARIDPVAPDITEQRQAPAGPIATPETVQSPAKVIASGAPRENMLTTSTFQSVSRWVAALYLLGVALILGRLLRGVWGGRRLRKIANIIDDAPLLEMVKKLARRLGLKVVPAVAWCGQISIPVVVGIVKPMILLPAAVVSGLTPDQLQALLLHELAHIRRFDPIVNLLQRIIEAVLFFHPAVWFVSRRISILREHAADDMVLAAGWDRPVYADALVRAAELASAFSRPDLARRATVLGASGTSQSEFKLRVLRLLEESQAPQLQLSRAGVLALLMVVALGGMLAWSQTDKVETASNRSAIGDSLDAARANGLNAHYDDDAPFVDKSTAAPEQTEKKNGGADEQRDSNAGNTSTKRTDDGQSIEALLESFSKVKYSWQQHEVARRIIELGDKEAISRIRPFADSTSRRTRCTAGLIMASLGDPAGRDIIINELQDTQPRPIDPDDVRGKPDVGVQIASDRYYAALLLGELRDKAAVPALIAATEDETINYCAAISLGEIGDQQAIPALRKMVKDFPKERLWAGYALAALGESDGFEILIETTSDAAWTQRRHAVEALGKIGDPKMIPTLVQVLKKDEHSNVRVSAAQSLAKIGDAAALPALTEALNDPAATETNAPTTVASEARKAIDAIEAKLKKDNQAVQADGLGTLLADAVRNFNVENKQLGQGLDQPALTADEVVEFITRCDRKRDAKDLNDQEFAAFKAVAESKRLPQDSYLQVYTEEPHDDFVVNHLWQVRLMLPAVGHDGFVGLTIRDTKVAEEKIDPRAVAWGRPDTAGLSLGAYLSPKKEKYQIGERVRLRLFVRNDGQKAVNTTWANTSHPMPEDFTVTDEKGTQVAVRKGQDGNWSEPWISGFMRGRLDPGDVHRLLVPYEIAIGGDGSNKLVGRVIDARAGQTLQLRVRESNGNDRERAKGEPEPESGSITFTIADAPAAKAAIDPNGEIVGRLVDIATGQPVAGATIACGAIINDSGKGGGANAFTDAEGNYRLPVPSPGIYNVWLKAFDKDPDMTAAADDGILVEPGKVSPSQLQLVKGRKVAGKVVNTLGKPFANLSVNCYSAARPPSGGIQSVKTRDGGTFEFALPPGRVHLYAFESVGRTDENVFGLGRAANAHFVVSATEEVAPITLTLDKVEVKFGDPEWLNRSTPGTQIVRHENADDVIGTVVDASGKPVFQASVFREDGPINTTTETGEFRVKIDKGTQFVMHAFAPGYHVWFGTPTAGDVLKIVLEQKVADKPAGGVPPVDNAPGKNDAG